MPGADGPGKREGSGRSPRARGAVPMERPERPGKAMGTGRHGWSPRAGGWRAGGTGHNPLRAGFLSGR